VWGTVVSDPVVVVAEEMPVPTGAQVTGSALLSLEMVEGSPFPLAAASPRPFFALFVFFFFSWGVGSQLWEVLFGEVDYLLPTPHRPEAVKESHIFKQIWV